MKKEIKEIDFQSNVDDRGSLVIIEEGKTIPFPPKRLFYISNVKDNKDRGNHANIKSEFIMVAIQGKVTVEIDDGKVKKEFVLDNPTKGIYIPNLTWKRMYNFEEKTILLVIANTLYDKEEYINNYDEFIEYINNN